MKVVSVESLTSLKCPKCGDKFSSVATDNKSPRLLSCRRSLCLECIRKEVSNHVWECPCILKKQCVKATVEQHISNYAFFGIIDELGEKASERCDYDMRVVEGTICFTVSHVDLETIECPICTNTYANGSADAARPFALDCGHTICTACFESEKKPYSNNGDFCVKCPKCMQESTKIKAGTYCDAVSIMDFLREWEGSQLLVKPVCQDCSRETPTDVLFKCDTCSEDEDIFMVCGACLYRMHRDHAVGELLGNMVAKLVSSMHGESQPRLETYKKMLPHYFQEISNRLNSLEKISNAAEKATLSATSLQQAEEVVAVSRAASSRFEDASEKFIPYLRRYQRTLDDIIQNMKRVTINREKANGKNEVKDGCDGGKTAVDPGTDPLTKSSTA